MDSHLTRVTSSDMLGTFGHTDTKCKSWDLKVRGLHYELNLKKKYLNNNEAMKNLTAIGKTSPFKDSGYTISWVGNLVFGFPVLVPLRVELFKEILSSKKYIDKTWLYEAGKEIFGTGLITR